MKTAREKYPSFSSDGKMWHHPLLRCRPAWLPLAAYIVFFVLAARFFCLPGHLYAQAAIIMESDGVVKSLGVPKGAAGVPDTGSGGAQLTPQGRNAAPYPDLPWGIVPEIHLFWPVPPYADDRQTPPRGNDAQRSLPGVPRTDKAGPRM